MAFPATQELLDDFKRADGALGANWVNALGTGGAAITGGQAGGTGASAWVTQLASATAVFARIPVVPATASVRLDLASDLVKTNFITAQINATTLSMTVSDHGGSTTSVSNVVVAGDWFAITYDPTTGNEWGFTWATATSGPWVFRAGLVASRPPVFTGWYAMIEFQEAVARLDNFGCELLPGAAPGAGVTSPVVHGRGAC